MERFAKQKSASQTSLIVLVNSFRLFTFFNQATWLVLALERLFSASPGQSWRQLTRGPLGVLGRPRLGQLRHRHHSRSHVCDGVYVGAGDVTGDGLAEVITGTNREAGPVRVFQMRGRCRRADVLPSLLQAF